MIITFYSIPVRTMHFDNTFKFICIYRIKSITSQSQLQSHHNNIYSTYIIKMEYLLFACNCTIFLNVFGPITISFNSGKLLMVQRPKQVKLFPSRQSSSFNTGQSSITNSLRKWFSSILSFFPNILPFLRMISSNMGIFLITISSQYPNTNEPRIIDVRDDRSCRTTFEVKRNEVEVGELEPI